MDHESFRQLEDDVMPMIDAPASSDPLISQSYFDGLTGRWPSLAVLSLWIFAGLMGYLFISNIASILVLAWKDVRLEDLISLPLSEIGTGLLVANAIGLALGLGAVAWLATRLDSSNPVKYLRLNRFTASDLLLSCMGFISLLPIVLYLAIFNEKLPLPDALRQLEEQQLQLIEWLGSGEGSFGLHLLLVALTPAIFEEVFFRGFVQRRAERWMGVSGGILFTGILFGIFHLRLTQVLPLMVLGCFLAYIGWRTGSIFLPMILHFLNNGLTLAVSNWGSQSLNNPQIIPVPLVAGSAIALLICIILLHRNHGNRYY